MYFSVWKASLTSRVWEALRPERRIVQEALTDLPAAQPGSQDFFL